MEPIPENRGLTFPARLRTDATTKLMKWPAMTRPTVHPCHRMVSTMSVAFQEESAQIRLKMASLRRHMHKDARGIVANTTQLLDWKD